MCARIASNIYANFYAGAWRFYDDGWPGTLSLDVLEGNLLQGTFYSDRFRAQYKATATISDEVPYRINIVFHEYNWLERQEYSGYLLAGELNTMAGYSYWRSERFSFVAFKERSPIPGSFRPGPVEPIDFAGDWALNLDGKITDVELTYDRETETLSGRFSGGRFISQQFDCTLTDGCAGHALHMVMPAFALSASHGPSLDGYLFTRPKSVIAGHANIDDVLAGFYLLRYR